MDKDVESAVQSEDVEETVKEGFESILEVLDIPGVNPQAPNESGFCDKPN